MEISMSLFLCLVTLSTSAEGKMGSSSTVGEKQQLCEKGQFKSSNHTCLPCRSGEFMSEARHAHRKCWPCTHCESQGLQATKRCSGSADARCCPLPGMILVDKTSPEKGSLSCFGVGVRGTFCCCRSGHRFSATLSGVECVVDKSQDDSMGLSVQRKVSTECGINQYLEEKNDTCRPCEKCTYRNQTGHRENKCTPCSTNNPRLAYCPASCSYKDTKVALRLLISGLIVVTFPVILVPLSLAIVSVAKQYNLI